MSNNKNLAVESMYIKKDDYERALLLAFSAGMNAGYGVEHTNITEDEVNAIREYAENMGFKRKTTGD